MQDVHDYDSMCEIPILATAEQYANEDQYQTVMEELFNITDDKAILSEICKSTCNNCDFTDASNYAVQDLINSWAACEAENVDLTEELQRKSECVSFDYEPLDCTDFNPAIFELKTDIGSIETECAAINENISEEREVTDMVVELHRIKSEIIDWTTAVDIGGLSCVFVPRLFCDAVSSCEWQEAEDVCVFLEFPPTLSDASEDPP